MQVNVCNSWMAEFKQNFVWGRCEFCWVERVRNEEIGGWHYVENCDLQGTV